MRTIDTSESNKNGWRIAEPLRTANFRWLWLGESISVLGSQLQMVALPWLILKTTGSTLMLGTIFMVAALPGVVSALYGGVLADRISPKLIMLSSNISRAVLSMMLMLLVVLPRAPFFSLYIITVAFSICDTLFFPAYYSIIPRVLPAETLSAGMALMQMSGRVAGIIGPGLAGIMVAAGGLSWAFGLNSLSFCFAAGTLTVVTVSQHGGTEAKVKVTGLMLAKEGVKYVKEDRPLQGMMIAAGLMNLAVTGPFMIALPTLARSQSGSTVQLGAMFSAMSGGALLGSICAGNMKSIRYRGFLTIALIAIVGAAIMGVALVPGIVGKSILIAMMAFCAGILNIVIITWLQARTQLEMRGRVMGLLTLSVQGLIPLSYAMAGLIAQSGAQTLLLVSGNATILIALGLLFNHGLRSID